MIQPRISFYDITEHIGQVFYFLQQHPPVLQRLVLQHLQLQRVRLQLRHQQVHQQQPVRVLQPVLRLHYNYE